MLRVVWAHSDLSSDAQLMKIVVTLAIEKKKYLWELGLNLMYVQVLFSSGVSSGVASAVET